MNNNTRMRDLWIELQLKEAARGSDMIESAVTLVFLLATMALLLVAGLMLM